MTSDRLLLRGGQIVDGSGQPAFEGDVLIEGDRIAAVGHALEGVGAGVVDVGGLIVAPGFIDPHTHYDAQIMWDPQLGSSVQYGVTTVLIGNCGFTIAPTGASDADAEYLIQMLARVEGMSERALRDGLPWTWRDFGDYLGVIDQPLGPNVMSLVGHSAIRYSVMGLESCERAALEDEVAAMQRSLRAALQAGAWGFTSATSKFDVDSAGRPVPSRLAETEEFHALADVLGEFPFGIIGHSPHSKTLGIGNSPDEELLTAMSLRGGASVNWNNLTYASAMPDLWRDNLAASEHAAERGAQVYAIYNPASSGALRVDFDGLVLFGSFPNWSKLALADRPARIRSFKDPAVRRQLREDLELTEDLGLIAAMLSTMWDSLRVTEVFAVENQDVEGKYVGDVARDLGEHPLDTALDIAVADDLRTRFILEEYASGGDESERARAAADVMRQSPFVVYGGSDAGAHLDMMTNQGLPARAIAEQVREHGSMALEEVVRGFTSSVADAFGVPDRGRVTPGMKADLVVFDLSEIEEGPAHVVNDLPDGSERLTTEARGVHYTIVNGEVAFEHGRPTGTLSGQLLRSP